MGLILNLKEDSEVIAGDVKIIVCRIQGKQVRLNFICDKSITIEWVGKERGKEMHGVQKRSAEKEIRTNGRIWKNVKSDI